MIRWLLMLLHPKPRGVCSLCGFYRITRLVDLDTGRTYCRYCPGPWRVHP